MVAVSYLKAKIRYMKVFVNFWQQTISLWFDNELGEYLS